MSLNLFSLFVSRGLSFHDTQTQISKTQTPGNKKEKKVYTHLNLITESKMFHSNTMFIGHIQKESSYLSSPVFRCRVWWIQNWLKFEQHYSDSVSSISSVKNLPANAVKISAVIIQLHFAEYK